MNEQRHSEQEWYRRWTNNGWTPLHAQTALLKRVDFLQTEQAPLNRKQPYLNSLQHRHEQCTDEVQRISHASTTTHHPLRVVRENERRRVKLEQRRRWMASLYAGAGREIKSPQSASAVSVEKCESEEKYNDSTTAAAEAKTVIEPQSAPLPDDDEFTSVDGVDLLQWVDHLDFDSYVNEWHNAASTGTGATDLSSFSEEAEQKQHKMYVEEFEAQRLKERNALEANEKLKRLKEQQTLDKQTKPQPQAQTNVSSVPTLSALASTPLTYSNLSSAQSSQALGQSLNSTASIERKPIVSALKSPSSLSIAAINAVQTNAGSPSDPLAAAVSPVKRSSVTFNLSPQPASRPVESSRLSLTPALSDSVPSLLLTVTSLSPSTPQVQPIIVQPHRGSQPIAWPLQYPMEPQPTVSMSRRSSTATVNAAAGRGSVTVSVSHSRALTRAPSQRQINSQPLSSAAQGVSVSTIAALSNSQTAVDQLIDSIARNANAGQSQSNQHTDAEQQQQQQQLEATIKANQTVKIGSSDKLSQTLKRSEAQRLQA